jgi:hypothetical protein
MDDSELKGPSLLRAFAPLWLIVGLLLFASVALPLVLALLLALADTNFRID